MKITKTQLKQIIKEELEVTLTNAEAGELFGEGVEAQLEEQELNEDLGQLANMLGSNPEELMIVLKALGLTAANLGGAGAAGLGMSKIIDMIRDYRERKAPPEGDQMMTEDDSVSMRQQANNKLYQAATPAEDELITGLETLMLKYASENDIPTDSKLQQILKLLIDRLEN